MPKGAVAMNGRAGGDVPPRSMRHQDLGFQLLASRLEDRNIVPSRGQVPRSTIAKKHRRLPPPKPLDRASTAPIPRQTRPDSPFRTSRPRSGLLGSSGSVRRNRAWHGLTSRASVRVVRPCRLSTKGVLLLLEFRSETALDSTEIKSWRSRTIRTALALGSTPRTPMPDIFR